jgi:hypothetical protein
MAGFIFQTWLDQVGDAFFADDFATYRAAVRLPLEVVSAEGLTLIGDETALRAKFDSWVAMLQTQRATQMIRTARDVVRIDDSTIQGDYDTDILHQGQRVMPRFSSSMILDLAGNTPRAIRVMTGINRQQWPDIQPAKT